MTGNRIAAAALAAFGAASGIPIPLAQLDFAGIVNVFDIDSGDSPAALLVIAGVGGFLTIGVLVAALAGAALTLAGSASSRGLLIGAAVAGLATAFPFWIPAGIVIGTAGVILGRAERPSGASPSLV
jgi:hypothetical protein